MQALKDERYELLNFETGPEHDWQRKFATDLPEKTRDEIARASGDGIRGEKQRVPELRRTSWQKEPSRSANADFYEELVNAQNERGATPYDQVREDKQGPFRMPGRGEIIGSNGEPIPIEGNRRPANLQEYVAEMVTLKDIPSPDGVKGSPAHLEAVEIARLQLAEDIERKAGLTYGTPDERRIKNRLFDRENEDRIGEQWKRQDFGGGRQVGAGLGRAEINERGKARKPRYAEDENGNPIVRKGKDGKVRRVREQRGNFNVDQMIGNPGPAANDAIRRIKAAIAAGDLSEDSLIDPSNFPGLDGERAGGMRPREAGTGKNVFAIAEGGRPRTVRELLDSLEGVTNGGIGLDRSRKEVEKLVAEDARRGAGVFTPVEIEAEKRRLENEILFGGQADIAGDTAFGANAAPTYSQAELRAELGGAREPLMDAELRGLQSQLDQIDGSTPEGRRMQEAVIGDMRRIMVQGRVGRDARPVQANPGPVPMLGAENFQAGPDPRFQSRVGGQNQFFNEDRFEAERRQGRVINAGDLYDAELGGYVRSAVDSLVDDAADFPDALVRQERRGRVRQANEEAAAEYPKRLADAAVARADRRKRFSTGRGLTPEEASRVANNAVREITDADLARFGASPELPIKGIKRERNRRDGNYSFALTPDRKAARRGGAPARPVMEGGDVVNFATPGGELIGDPNFKEVTFATDGPERRVRSWIEQSLFEPAEMNRPLGEVAEDVQFFPRHQQIGQPLQQLSEKMAAAGVAIPEQGIRNMMQFEEAADRFIQQRIAQGKPFFMDDGQGGKTLVSDPGITEVLRDIKFGPGQTDLARALYIGNQAALMNVNQRDKEIFYQGLGLEGRRHFDRMQNLVQDAAVRYEAILGRPLKQKNLDLIHNIADPDSKKEKRQRVAAIQSNLVASTAWCR